MKSLGLLRLIIPVWGELTDDIVIQFKSYNETVITEFEELYGLQYIGQLFDDHAHFRQAHRQRDFSRKNSPKLSNFASK